MVENNVIIGRAPLMNYLSLFLLVLALIYRSNGAEIYESTGAESYAVNISEALDNVKCEANSSRFINVNFTMVYTQSNESMDLNLTTSDGYSFVHVSANTSRSLQRLFLVGTAFRSDAITTAEGEKTVVLKDECREGLQAELNVAENRVYGEKTEVNGTNRCSVIVFGNVTGFKYTAEQGLDANAKDELGMSPLHYAAMFGDLTAIRQLISREANVSVRWADIGTTPLHFASIRGDRDVIRTLVESGADVDAKDNNGVTPLVSAVIANQSAAVEELIKQGANLTDGYEQIDSPLHLAASRGYTHIIDILIDNGMDVNKKNPDNKTPLHLAIESYEKATVQQLIQRGSEIKLTDLVKRYGKNKISELIPINFIVV